MNKIKNLAFSWNLKGYGVINYNGTVKDGSNVIYAKKNWYRSDDPENPKCKPKISRDCLMHGMFGDVQSFHSPYCHPQVEREIFMNYLVQELAAIRGYLKTKRKSEKKKDASNESESGSGQKGFTRSSAFICRDAELSNDAEIRIEQFSRSGERNNTSIFSKETIGKAEWETDGFINLQALQFLSCDQRFDNQGFDQNDIKLFKERTSEYYDIEKIKIAYFAKVGSVSPELEAEYGVHYDEDWVKRCLKFVIKKMLDLNITRSKAYVRNDVLKVAPICCGYDTSVLEDKNDPRWITLTIDNYESVIDGIEIFDHFMEVPEENVIKLPKEESKKK